MKLKKMIHLIRDTKVIIHCGNRSLLEDDTFIIHNCNYTYELPKELLKCKVTAVIPDYNCHSVNIYVW